MRIKRGVLRDSLLVWISELDIFARDVKIGVLLVVREPGRSPSIGQSLSYHWTQRGGGLPSVWGLWWDWPSSNGSGQVELRPLVRVLAIRRARFWLLLKGILLLESKHESCQSMETVKHRKATEGMSSLVEESAEWLCVGGRSALSHQPQACIDVQ